MPRGASFLNLCFRFIHQFATLFLHIPLFIDTICIYVQHGLCLFYVNFYVSFFSQRKIKFLCILIVSCFLILKYATLSCFFFFIEFFVHLQYFTVLLMSQDGCLIRPISVPPFLAILPSHGKKNKGPYSQPSFPQCPKRAK